MRVILGSVMLLGLVSAAAATDKKFECYNNAVVAKDKKTDDQQLACWVATTEAKGTTAVTRGGYTDATPAACTEIKTKTCTGGGWSKCEEGTVKTCVCKSNLCNGAPTTAAATLFSLIAMALIAKFMI